MYCAVLSSCLTDRTQPVSVIIILYSISFTPSPYYTVSEIIQHISTALIKSLKRGSGHIFDTVHFHFIIPHKAVIDHQ